MAKRIYILLFIFVFMASCREQEVVEVKESSQPVEELIVSIVDFYSTFDVLDDFISNSPFMGKKTDQLIPYSVEVIVHDSTFLDGDGVSVSLDFGELGNKVPYGVLCKDERYRAGVIHFTLNKWYSESDAELEIEFDALEPFYSGDGETMLAYEGHISLQKLGEQSYFVSTKDLDFSENGTPVGSLECSTTILKTEDHGAGIMNDKVKIDGFFHLEDSEGERIEANITESLRKEYTQGCISNILSGALSVDFNHSLSEVTADFDPFDDGACDNVVEITINGKPVIFEY